MKRITTYNLKTLLFVACIILLAYSAKGQTQKGANINGVAAGDVAGWSTSMPDANTVAIGAYGNDGNGNQSGNVRVYQWVGSTWLQKGADINGEAAMNMSGCSVSMPDANTLAIGAYGNDDNGTDAGHVRVYHWVGNSWVQKGADIDGKAANDLSGFSVSMPDDNTVAIGAYGNDDNGMDAGHVRVFSWNGTSWNLKGNNINGESSGDGAGSSVSMPNTNTVAIGSPTNSTNGIRAGHVRVFRWNGIAWVQKGTSINGEAVNDRSGTSISMPDDNTIAIGAPINSGNGIASGHVRVYVWDGSKWGQKGLDIDGEGATDYSGSMVSMPDTNTVAIGAFYNDGNGTDAGHVRIYGWNGTAWIQKGSDINGDVAGDRSGNSVSMPDANTVAIGSPGSSNSPGGIPPGHVRVFTLTSAKILKNSFGNCLKAFPNPTLGDLNIELGANYNNVSVIVRNATGQEVLRKSFSNANSLQINIQGEPGFYTVEVTAQDKKALLKVMKK